MPDASVASATIKIFLVHGDVFPRENKPLKHTAGEKSIAARAEKNYEAGRYKNALKEYSNEVRELKFPAKENFYEIKEEELEKLLGDVIWKYECTKEVNS